MNRPTIQFEIRQRGPEGWLFARSAQMPNCFACAPNEDVLKEHMRDAVDDSFPGSEFTWSFEHSGTTQFGSTSSSNRRRVAREVA